MCLLVEYISTGGGTRGLGQRVGKQGRGAHYKRRMNPEERQNISTTAGRGGERETEARWEAGREKNKAIRMKTWKRGFFLTSRAASLLYHTRRRDLCRFIIITLRGICEIIKKVQSDVALLLRPARLGVLAQREILDACKVSASAPEERTAPPDLLSKIKPQNKLSFYFQHFHFDSQPL